MKLCELADLSGIIQRLPNDGSYAILSVEPSSFSSLTRRSLVTVKAASSDAMFVTIIEFLGNFFQCAFIVDFEV